MHDHILHVLTIPAEAACSFIALGEMAGTLVCVCLWIAKIMYVQSCSTNTLKEVTSQCF
ncbi:hypothetical protein CASFOL_022972 [Castilleja foliolosa]|uniref:Uncharacterized protein n=1 Tax=Castilleja foliolosa TaxID=1961234 RepID=A0ABD3CT98_9LAMI